MSILKCQMEWINKKIIQKKPQQVLKNQLHKFLTMLKKIGKKIIKNIIEKTTEVI